MPSFFEKFLKNENQGIARSRAFLLFLLITFVGTIFLRTVFVGPEYELYISYAESIITDGDLNIANQLMFYDFHRPVLLSETLNYPDFHNNGGIVIWAPFLLIGKLFQSTGLHTGFARFEPVHFFLSLSTLICGVLSLFLIYRIALLFTGGSARSSFISVIAMFFGTPYIFYMIIQPGQANIYALFLSALLVYILLELDLTAARSWVVPGFLLSVSFLTKVDLWPMAGLAALVFFEHLRSKKAGWRHLMWFGLSFMVLFAFKFGNDFLKFGHILSNELSVVNSSGFYFFTQLFSPFRGYFIYSPVFLFAMLAGLWVLLFRRGQPESFGTRGPLILWGMFFIIIIKLFIISFRFNWNGGTYGGRILLTEVPFFAVFLAVFLKGLRGWGLRVAFSVLCVMLIWNILKIAEFMTFLEPRNFISYVDFANGWAALHGLYAFILKNIGLAASIEKIGLLAFLLAVAAPFIYLLRRVQVRHAVAGFVFYCAAAYAAISVMNYVNNGRNAELLRGYVEAGEMVVIKPHLFTMEENIGSVNEQMEFYESIGDEKEVRKLMFLRESLFEHTDDEFRRARPSLF